MGMARGFGKDKGGPTSAKQSVQDEAKKNLGIDQSLEEFLERVKKTDLKEGKNASAEELLDNFMKEKFSTLSLLSAKDVPEVMTILASANLDTFRMEEVSLFLFYLGDLEGEVDPSKIEDLIQKGLTMAVQNPQEIQTDNFIKALGILASRKGVGLSDDARDVICHLSEKVKARAEGQVEMLKAYSYILEDEPESLKAAVKGLLLGDGEKALIEHKIVDPVELSEIFYILFKSEYKSNVLLDALVKNMIVGELDSTSAANTLLALNSLGYQNSESYKKLFASVLSSPVILANQLATLLESSLNNNITDLPFSQILTTISREVEQLTPQGYVEVFKSIAMIKAKKIQVDVNDTMEVLKRNFAAHTFDMKDLQIWDILSIMSSLLSMKDQDLSFVKLFLEEIEKREALEECDGLQLFLLTKILYSYSKYFPKEFVKAHSVSARRMDEIPPEYKPMIKEMVKQRSDLIPNSPFLSI